MTINIQYEELTFTPSLLDTVLDKLKSKVTNIKNNLFMSSMCSMFEVAYNESLTLKNRLIQDKEKLTISDMKKLDFDSMYDMLEELEDKLWTIHEITKKSKREDGIKLFNILDKTLDNYAKISNILGYFESQIIQDNLKSA